jgi:hypothetical protein
MVTRDCASGCSGALRTILFTAPLYARYSPIEDDACGYFDEFDFYRSTEHTAN